jgi:hypothetical protein
MSNETLKTFLHNVSTMCQSDSKRSMKDIEDDDLLAFR